MKKEEQAGGGAENVYILLNNFIVSVICVTANASLSPH